MNREDTVRLSYIKIRDVSTPQEEENNASTYIAVVPAEEILKIGTDDNLRDYIPGHPGKKRSSVHKAIENTIKNKPDRFSQLNSGFLVGAAKVKVDDQKKTVTLWSPSVNNGAQSQGEIRRYFDFCTGRREEPNEFFLRVEISIDPDSATRTEIAIARNTATRIQDVSQAGKRGCFDDLDSSFIRVNPNHRLAKSETDLGDEFVDTRLLLQVLWALIPQILVPATRTSIESRMRAYKNAALCLTEFVDIFSAAKEGGDSDATDRYKYFEDMAGEAWKCYEHWRTHPGWAGKYLRSDAKQVMRSEDEVVVPDGIVFPVLAALSNFVRKTKQGKWILDVPGVFDDEYLLSAAVRQLRQHQGKPMLMGRSGPAYEGLMLLTEMANKFEHS